MLRARVIFFNNADDITFSYGVKFAQGVDPQTSFLGHLFHFLELTVLKKEIHGEKQYILFHFLGLTVLKKEMHLRRLYTLFLFL